MKECVSILRMPDDVSALSLHVLIGTILFALPASTIPTSTLSSSTRKHDCKTITEKTVIISKVTINRLKLSTYDTTVGTVVQISCINEDFQVTGATTLKCLPSGEWSEDIPSCTEKTVKKPNNNKIIIGLSVGGGCAVICIIITILLVRRRLQNGKPTKHLDERLNKGKQKKIYTEEMKNRYAEQETTLDRQPNVYKVWSHDRSLKKFVTASNLNDLKQKGSKVFGIKDAFIVLEEDGTEIEDDIALEACKNKTLQIISTDKSWYRDSIISAPNEVLDLRGGSVNDNISEFGTIRSYHL